MYDGVKETLCTHCSHREVCAYKEQFLTVQKAVDNVAVSIEDHSVIYLHDISWIRPVKLECSYFSEKMSTTKRECTTASAALTAIQTPTTKFMEDPYDQT